MLVSALESAGLGLTDVTVRTLTLDAHLAAFTAREVDAVVTFEPVLSQVRAAGGHVVFDSRAIPGRVVDVFAVTAAARAERPAQVERLVDGWFGALDAVRADPDGTAAIMAPRSGMDAAAFEQAVADMRFPDREENGALLGGADPRLARAGLSERAPFPPSTSARVASARRAWRAVDAAGTLSNRLPGGSRAAAPLPRLSCRRPPAR
jgi:NitT/TauT family transport system substrate-binding protein